jgi:hypothetical protein
MLMRYRDMSELRLGRPARQLRFRIERSLEYFVSEYNHFEPSHHLDLTFGSAADVEALAASGAWARMQALCISMR